MIFDPEVLENSGDALDPGPDLRTSRGTDVVPRTHQPDFALSLERWWEADTRLWTDVLDRGGQCE